ncbi:MAG: MFS transporter [Gemmataceae bacterium]|nr:MFS transporter [Gemmataceae bacterium]
MRTRLAAMMFLQYFIMGVWNVTLPTFLMAPPHEGGLALSGQQVGLLYATHAVAGSIAPFLVGLLADRFFEAQRVLGMLHIGGAGVLLTMNRYCVGLTNTAPSSDTWPILLGLFFANALCYMPTIPLTTAIALRNLPDPAHQFGQVRVVGTLGWLVAGMGVGLFVSPVSPLPLLLASVSAFLLGMYAFLLPHTPPAHEGKTLSQMLGLPAIRMFARPTFRTFVLVTLLSTVLTSFHNIYLNRFLVDLGLQHAAAWQTVGQWVEIGCILAIPLVRHRFGLKRMMLFGLACSVVRYVLYATGSLTWLISVGLPMHGMCYSFYFIAAALFVDAAAPRDLRASAQGLVSLLTLGVGAFAGNWLAGTVVDACRGPSGVNWPAVWTIPAIGSAVAMVWFAMRFAEPTLERTPPIAGDLDPAAPA